MDKTAKILNGMEVIFLERIAIADTRREWRKLDEIELAAIKNMDDLVMQVQANYGLDKNQAQTRVDLWANGREF